MKKSIYLIPFIFVYKIVAFFIKSFLTVIKYINVGFFITCFTFISLIVNAFYYTGKAILMGVTYFSYLFYKYIIKGICYFIKYTFKGLFCFIIALLKIISSIIKHLFIGFIILSYLVFKIIKYIVMGISFPFVYGSHHIVLFNKSAEIKKAKRQAESERREKARERNKLIEAENKQKLIEVKKKEKEALEIRKQTQKEERSTKDIYINENVKIEKKKLSDYINNFFLGIGNVPKMIKNKFEKTSIARNAKNKKDINRQALLLNLEGEDALKSEKKVMYKYIAKTEEGKVITGYFPAHSKVEVHSFLLSEGNEVYSIKTNSWITAMYGNGNTTNKTKIKTADLIFFTTQLSTYIKAGITLVESLKILSKQFKNKKYSQIFRSMVYDLTMGDSFSEAMNKQGEAFPKLLINMLKASEMTGELPEALDDMSDYFTETDRTRKQMVTAMVYPAMIFVVAVAAVAFIMIYVVPQFVGIYDGIDGAEIPGITLFVIAFSNILQLYYLHILVGTILFIFVFVYLVKNVKSFKTFVQWMMMHTPVIKNVIIYNEVTMFTKTFSSLLSHNVFITDSMDILNKITNNEIYKMLILDTINNLAKGDKISLAFKDHWAFPIPAYEMITTGERTGQLPEMMSKVSTYYQEMHRNSVTRIKTFVEPILIIFLTVVVGGIVLAIVIPMFSIYNAVGL